MAQHLKDYLECINRTIPGAKKEEKILMMLRSDEAVNIMWQTFTLQCNEAINGISR